MPKYVNVARRESNYEIANQQLLSHIVDRYTERKANINAKLAQMNAVGATGIVDTYGNALIKMNKLVGRDDSQEESTEIKALVTGVPDSAQKAIDVHNKKVGDVQKLIDEGGDNNSVQKVQEIIKKQEDDNTKSLTRTIQEAAENNKGNNTPLTKVKEAMDAAGKLVAPKVKEKVSKEFEDRRKTAEEEHNQVIKRLEQDYTYAQTFQEKQNFLDKIEQEKNKYNTTMNDLSKEEQTTINEETEKAAVMFIDSGGYKKSMGNIDVNGSGSRKGASVSKKFKSDYKVEAEQKNTSIQYDEEYYFSHKRKLIDPVKMSLPSLATAASFAALAGVPDANNPYSQLLTAKEEFLNNKAKYGEVNELIKRTVNINYGGFKASYRNGFENLTKNTVNVGAGGSGNGNKKIHYGVYSFESNNILNLKDWNNHYEVRIDPATGRILEDVTTVAAMGIDAGNKATGSFMDKLFASKGKDIIGRYKDSVVSFDITDKNGHKSIGVNLNSSDLYSLGIGTAGVYTQKEIGNTLEKYFSGKLKSDDEKYKTIQKIIKSSKGAEVALKALYGSYSGNNKGGFSIGKIEVVGNGEILAGINSETINAEGQDVSKITYNICKSLNIDSHDLTSLFNLVKTQLKP